MIVPLINCYYDDGYLLKHLDPHKRGKEMRIYVPHLMTRRVIELYHSTVFVGHQGINVTYRRLCEHYYWPRMYSDVVEFIQKCEKCALNKRCITLKGPGVFIEVQSLFDLVGFDLTGPLATSTNGNQYILAFIDYFTRYTVTVAIQDCSAESIAKAYLERVVAYFGPCSKMLSDQGPNLISAVMTEVCRLFETKRLMTTAYHPQTNGRIERFWGTLKTMLRMYTEEDQETWEEVLPLLTYAYNSGIRTSTGFSPHEVVFGRKPKLPFEDLKVLSKNDLDEAPELVTTLASKIAKIEKAVRASNKEYIEKQKKAGHKKRVRKLKLKPGDLVLKKVDRYQPGQCKSLSPLFDGPHRVCYVPLDGNSVIVRLFDEPQGQYIKVSLDKLKVFTPPLVLEDETYDLNLETN